MGARWSKAHDRPVSFGRLLERFSSKKQNERHKPKKTHNGAGIDVIEIPISSIGRKREPVTD
jgi:hypothetical protein